MVFATDLFDTSAMVATSQMSSTEMLCTGGWMSLFYQSGPEGLMGHWRAADLQERFSVSTGQF